MGDDDPRFDRREFDQIPPQVRKYIRLAAKAGAEETMLQLGGAISSFGLKKVVYAVGAAVVGLLSAMTAWFLHSGGAPK